MLFRQSVPASAEASAFRCEGGGDLQATPPGHHEPMGSEEAGQRERQRCRPMGVRPCPSAAQWAPTLGDGG